MTRFERRSEIVDAIQALKGQPQSVERDLRIELLAAQRNLVDSYQVAEHWEFRAAKLRKALFGYLLDELGARNAPGELDEIDKDERIEARLPVPSCKHCGKALA